MTERPAIIMVHGFRGTHHGLQLIRDRLEDYEVIVPDLPGFGTQAPLSSHDLVSYVQWLHTFIVQKKFTQPPVLLGHSFGSIITAAYAATYPDSIATLILVNPIGAPALRGPQAGLTMLTVAYYWIGRQLPKKLATKWLSARSIVKIMSIAMTTSKDPKVRAYVHKQHLLHFSQFASPTVVAQAFATSTKHDVRASAPSIFVPTLLIAGQKDMVTPLKKQRALAALFANARLIVIENVGHLTHYETPDQVADLIKKFIR